MGSLVSLHPLHFAQDLPLVRGQQRAVVWNFLKHCAALKLIAGFFEVVPVRHDMDVSTNILK